MHSNNVHNGSNSKMCINTIYRWLITKDEIIFIIFIWPLCYIKRLSPINYMQAQINSFTSFICIRPLIERIGCKREKQQ